MIPDSAGPIQGLEPGSRQPLLSRTWSGPWPALLPALNANQQQQIRTLVHLWRRHGLSRWNPRRAAAVPDTPFVLVAGGLWQRKRLLEQASHHHPGLRTIWLDGQRGHPAALLREARGLISSRVRWSLEALMWGLTVNGPVLRSLPALAGLSPGTEDGRIAAEALLHHWLVQRSLYFDPDTRQPCPPERVFEAVSRQLQRRRQQPDHIEAVDIHPYNRTAIRRYLAGARVSFRRSRSAAPSPVNPVRGRSVLAVMGRQEQPEHRAAALENRLITIEDGFIRSVGRAPQLKLPLSLALDPVGIYYDATRPSRLEQILLTHPFTSSEGERAERLRRRIIQTDVSKYNLRGGSWQRPAGHQPVVLVVGQVENDASLRYGAPDLRSNFDLVRAARRLEPKAWLIYKPHPYVASGRRQTGREEHRCVEHCDQVITDVSISSLLRQVDRVHVLTSGAGFEALLHRVPVVTHGLPFYAGWGLTDDRLHSPRRTRRLSLDQLVFGSLVLYPTYISPRSGWYIEVEEALDALIELRNDPSQNFPFLYHLARNLLALAFRRGS